MNDRTAKRAINKFIRRMKPFRRLHNNRPYVYMRKQAGTLLVINKVNENVCFVEEIRICGYMELYKIDNVEYIGEL